MSDLDSTLDQRGERYGDFCGHAAITQGIKRVMAEHDGWRRLSDSQREALEMIAHKIGRVLNGDPDYADSWHDIAGYARLVEQEVEQEVEQAPKRHAGYSCGGLGGPRGGHVVLTDGPTKAGA